MAQKTLNEDLNVLSNSDLEITYLNGDLNIIQKLDDEPNDVGGLTSAELKAKFDEAGNIIKDYINETLIPELLASDATEAEREAAESERETAETARAAAEESRATAESGRATAEAARVLAENARAAAETQRATAETARAEAETARASEFTALKSAAEQATEDADSSALAVQNMTVSAQTLTAGSAATVSKGTNDNGGISLAFGIPKGEKGEKGDKGDKGEPGKDGSGSGDMSASDYDPNSAVKAGGGISAYVTAQTAAMTAHIADRSNPHGVTAAQVGARPDTWTPTASEVGAIPTAQKGAAGGVASLDADGKVPTDQIPDIGVDAFSKEETLTETTAAQYGLSASAVPDDVFAMIHGQLNLIMNSVASITVTLKDSAGTAIPGVLVQGILSDSGQAVYSNDSGVAAGYISEGTQVVKVTGYADIVDYSETLSVTKGTTITKTITLTTRNFLKITSSQSVKFSGNVETVDVTVVGGGGGGGSCYYNHTVVGGGGGYCTVQENVNFTKETLYSAIVGAGGAGSGSSYKGSDGGTSSFLGLSAKGGNGGNMDSYVNPSNASSYGLGNGRGGYAYQTHYDFKAPDARVEPTTGSVAGYDSFSTTVYYGGGGQGGCYYLTSDKDDGYGVNNTKTTYGGTCSYSPTTGANGYGGGARYCADSNKGGAAGGSGCIAIRMHLKSA